MAVNKKTGVDRHHSGLTNPMIYIDTNQEFSMCNYAANPSHLQIYSALKDVTVSRITALGYTPEEDNFIQLQISFRRCNNCRSNLRAEIYGNWNNRVAFGICPKCSREIFFPNLSDLLTTSNFESDGELKEMIG